MSSLKMMRSLSVSIFTLVTTSRIACILKAKKGKELQGQRAMRLQLYIYPQGMEYMVTYVKDRYNNTPMFITENGYRDMNEQNSSMTETLNDVERVGYMKNYLDALAAATRNGADVRGYFAWSLLDNFEWKQRYTVGFGIYHVNYQTLERTAKLSSTRYKNFISNHSPSREYSA